MGAAIRRATCEFEPSTQAEQELQSLSYMISHDFAATIRQLTEFSRLLVQDLENAATPRQRLFADRIRDAGDRGAAMLESLSLYSQVQRQNLVRVSVDATVLVRQTLLRRDAEIKSIAAEISVEPLGEVLADPDLLTLAVAALIDNAIKFRRPNVAPRIRVAGSRESAGWRLRVHDNGLGVAAPHREAVFTMFRRLNARPDVPGVGAGLAICRRIARRHGGEVQFLESPEGACVELSVPDAAAPSCVPRRIC